MKKYKLRRDLSIDFMGRTLFRIECTKEIEGKGVKVGDLGGFIEKEDNLSGDAWIYGNAKVCNNARVHGKARVCDDAEVFGSAEVCGNAEVRDNAKVCSNAIIYGNADVRGDAYIYGNAKVWGSASIYGNAVVYDGAKVYDYAEVSGKASIYDNARVSGKASIYGNAVVHGKARVCDDASIYGNAVVSGDAIKKQEDCINITRNCGYNVTITPKFIKIGCQFHTKTAWWGFTDKDIVEMDGEEALDFWKKWKPILQAICDTGEKDETSRN